MASKKAQLNYPNVIEMINKRGMTVNHASKSIGLTYRQLYGRLTGECQFQLLEMAKLSKILGVTMDYLFSPSQNQKSKSFIDDKQQNAIKRLEDGVNQLVNEFIENYNKKT